MNKEEFQKLTEKNSDAVTKNGEGRVRNRYFHKVIFTV